MRLDVLEVARVLEGRAAPVERAHPAVQVRVPVADRAQVALKVADVYRVEADL